MLWELKRVPITYVFIKEKNQKIILQKHHLIRSSSCKSYADLSLKSTLIRLIFYYKFV